MLFMEYMLADIKMCINIYERYSKLCSKIANITLINIICNKYFVILSTLFISTILFGFAKVYYVYSKISLENTSYCLNFFLNNINCPTYKYKTYYNKNDFSNLLLESNKYEGILFTRTQCLQDYHFFFLELNHSNSQLLNNIGFATKTSIKVSLKNLLYYTRILYAKILSNIFLQLLYKDIYREILVISKKPLQSFILYKPTSILIASNKCIISSTASGKLFVLCNHNMQNFQHIHYFVIFVLYISAICILYIIFCIIDNNTICRNKLDNSILKPMQQSNSISILTHELRTPISIIISLADILQNKISQYQQKTLFDINEQIELQESNYISDIKLQGIRMLNLVDSMLELDQISKGNIKLNCSIISIVDIIERIILTFFVEISEKNILIIREYEDINVFADKKKLSQCFEHVLSNAIKFNKYCGEILIKIFLSLENRVIVKFRDSGIGIADIARVFECFYQVDSGLNRRFNGTGVGLFVVKNLSDIQNIEVFINSEENIFTEVIFQFPKMD